MGRFRRAWIAFFASAFWIALTAGLAVTASANDSSFESDDMDGWSTVTIADTVTCTNDPGCTCTECTPKPGVIDQPGLLQLLWHNKQDHGDEWTARFDAILLWRNAPQSRPLFSTIAPDTTTLGPTALNANQLQSDVLAAPRVSLFKGNGCGDGIEATYIYAGNFYSQRSLTPVVDGYATSPPGILGNVWDPAAGTPLTGGTATLVGSLQSFEVNTRSRMGLGATQFILGVRWLQWQESARIQDYFTGPNVGDTGFDLYQTNCVNDLYGGQIGIDSVLLTTSHGLRVEGLVKAGAYYNNAVQSSSFYYQTDAPFSFGPQANRVGRSPASGAFAGEVGLTAIVPIHCNWDLRCGYFGLWLESIAQPMNQLSGQNLVQVNAPPGTLTTNGSLVLQGLSLGLEGRW